MNRPGLAHTCCSLVKSVHYQWTLIGLPKQQSDLPDSMGSPYAIWVRDALEVAYDQVRQHSGQAVQRQKRLYDRRSVKRLFAVGDWVMRYYTLAKKCKLDSAWIGP